MIQLKQLLNLYVHGALNIKYEPNKPLAYIGETQLNSDMARTMCMNLGWNDFALNPFEIIDKTKKFMAALKKNMVNQYIWDNAYIYFENKSSSEYGKTFDRIHIACGKAFEISILYKMPGNTSTYVIFNSFTSVPVQKCKSLKQVGEYINTLV